MVNIHCSSFRSNCCHLLSKSHGSLHFSAFYCVAVLLVQKSVDVVVIEQCVAGREMTRRAAFASAIGNAGYLGRCLGLCSEHSKTYTSVVGSHLPVI